MVRFLRWARFGASLWLCAVLAPSMACAQDALDRAERQLEEAQFEQAAQTLSELSESDGPLSRESVARLLRLRAVVGVALGRERAVRRDLLALAAVLDGREAGPMPRQLATQLGRARDRVSGPPDVRVRIDAELGEVRARLRLGEDPGGLIQRTELVCFSDGEELARTEAHDVAVAARPEVRCEARAYGPGGWLIDRAEARHSSLEAPSSEAETDYVLPAVLGGVGAAVLIGVITGIVVGTTAGRGVGGPMWTP